MGLSVLLLPVVFAVTVIQCHPQNDRVQFTVEKKDWSSDEDFSIGVEVNTEMNGNNKRQYVNAIKNSTIWNEVKKKIVTVEGPEQIAEYLTKFEDEPMENWTENMLEIIKDVCDQSITCMVVDHLVTISRYIQTNEQGLQTMRTVVTKVSNLLSEHSKSYAKSIVQFDSPIDTRNTDTVVKSIMNIVQDNSKICKSNDLLIKIDEHNVDKLEDRVSKIDDIMDVIAEIMKNTKA